MKANHAALLVVASVLLGLIAFGCNNNPIMPSSDINSSPFSALAGGPVQFAARVATMDQTRRMLMFAGKPDTVIAYENCEIFRLQNGLDVAAQFGEIKAGDSIQVFANREQSRLVYAYRLRICSDSGNGNMVVGRIRTMDQNRLMLTLAGKPDTIVANENCQMFCWKNGGEAPVQFWQMQFGDSVEITGQKHQNGYMYATKIKLCGDKTQCQYDVAFRDTIVAIDYAAGLVLVKNHTETIMVDSSTLIWGVITRLYEKPTDVNPRQQRGSAASGGGNYAVSRKDTLLVLTDLALGDVIEVRANTIDANTLLAVQITLAACNDVEKKCVEFNATIASVDATARIVTFDGLNWIGTICSGAKLAGLTGEELTLDAFAVGDYVAVKGFPLADDTLKICQMSLTTP